MRSDSFHILRPNGDTPIIASVRRRTQRHHRSYTHTLTFAAQAP